MQKIDQNALDKLSQHIEALVFSSEKPVSVAEIKSCLETVFESKIKNQSIESALEGLITRYQDEQFAFELVSLAGGFQFLTKGAFHPTVGAYLRQITKRRLSKSALETLSIIAYKQPVTKSEMERIRGVSCDYSVQKLLEKELVDIIGRSDAPGRPLLYGTSEKFMNYFGINSTHDLPKPKDFKEPESAIGEAAPIEEFTPINDTKETE